MNTKIETLLKDEIRSEMEELSKIEVGSEQYKIAVDGISKLADRVIEMERLEKEYEEKELSRKDETDMKLIELEEERKDRIIKNCLTGMGIVVPTGLAIWGTLKSLKFEETGTVTTIMGRGFINKLLPKK